MILLVILATVICTLLGGYFAIKFKDKLHLILGFSAGTILGVALFDLLPESIELTSNNLDIHAVMILVAIGFASYLFIDRLFSLEKHGDDCKKNSHNGRLSVVMLILHSFLDGFSIGLAFKVSPDIGWVVAAAVLAHKFSDGINTVSVIIKDKARQKEVIRWLLASSLAPVLGVVLAYFLNISKSTLGIVLAIFTGLFLYISASELIPESHHHHPVIWTSILTIFGMLLILLVSSFAV